MSEIYAKPRSPKDKSQLITFNLILATICGGVFPAFQHGFNTGVLNAPKERITDWLQGCNITQPHDEVVISDCAMTKEEADLEFSFFVAVFCIGGAVGGVMVALLSLFFGRKTNLIWANVLIMVGGTMMAFSKTANSSGLLTSGRFFVGITSGINAGLGPMYLSEISPVKIRGCICTVYQLTITVAILMSQCLGSQFLMGSSSLWPIMLGIIMLPAIINVVFFQFCCESPKYSYIDRRNELEAISSITWLRGDDRQVIAMELRRYEAERKQLEKSPPLKIMDLLWQLRYLRPLIVAVMMMLAQQLTGINAVMYYSTAIFNDVGLDGKQSEMATIGMGCANVLATILSLFIMDRAGRKSLMLWGLIGMLASTAVLYCCRLLIDQVRGLTYLSIFSVVTFVCSFAVGPGPIPWFFVSELFEQNARPSATSVAVVVNWLANFAMGLGFIPISNLISEHVFIVLLFMQMIFIPYVWKFVPETKGKTVREIAALFGEVEDEGDAGVEEDLNISMEDDENVAEEAGDENKAV